MVKIRDEVKQEAILDTVDFLMRHGFNPTEAVKVSKAFWKKHKKKLKNVI